MGTPTLRNDIAAGLKALVDGYIVANPGQLNGSFRSRPKNLGDRPLAFIGSRTETINHTGNTLYQRNPVPSVVFVWAAGLVDEGELADVRDDIIDAFITYAMPLPHAVSSDTTCSPTSVEDVEIEMDGAFYPASIVTFQVYSLGGSL